MVIIVWRGSDSTRRSRCRGRLWSTYIIVPACTEQVGGVPIPLDRRQEEEEPEGGTREEKKNINWGEMTRV